MPLKTTTFPNQLYGVWSCPLGIRDTTSEHGRFHLSWPRGDIKNPSWMKYGGQWVGKETVLSIGVHISFSWDRLCICLKE